MQSTIRNARLHALRVLPLGLGLLLLTTVTTPLLAGPAAPVPGTVTAPSAEQTSSSPSDVPPPPPPFQDGGAFGLINPKGPTTTSTTSSLTGTTTGTSTKSELERWFCRLFGIELE